MRILIDGTVVNRSIVASNSGLNYGRFDITDKPVVGYRLEMDQSKFVHNFSELYWKVLQEIREDDERQNESSPFKKTGYVSLEKAFQYPQHLVELLETYFHREIINYYFNDVPTFEYLINSTDRVYIEEAVVFDGRCIDYR